MWITPSETDLLTIFSSSELATYRAAALAAGQADPVAPTLAQVVDLVRGYVGAYKPNSLGTPGTIPQKLLAPTLDLVAVRLPQRVGVAPKDVRKLAADQAVKLFEQVAAGIFNIEEPDTYTTETTAAPAPTINSNVYTPQFTRCTEDGV